MISLMFYYNLPLMPMVTYLVVDNPDLLSNSDILKTVRDNDSNTTMLLKLKKKSKMNKEHWKVLT